MHEKMQRQKQWEHEHAASTEAEQALRSQYDRKRAAALQEFLQSSKAKEAYEQSFPILLLQLYERTEPHRSLQAAHEAAVARTERDHFHVPESPVSPPAQAEMLLGCGIFNDGANAGSACLNRPP
jgi:Tfp pilus assembly protein PilO